MATQLLTRSDQVLLAALAECGGQAVSLFELAVNGCGLAYSHAWRRVAILEAAGLLLVQRNGPGRPMLISLATAIGGN